MARVFLVGATSAIAVEIARTYAARGDALYLVGRDGDKLRAAEAAVREAGREAGGTVVGSAQVDLVAERDYEALVARADEALGGIDVCLVAHGYLGSQLESEASYEHAEAVFDANLLSVVGVLIPVANRMEARAAGGIVVISSVAGDRGRPRNYTYGAAKGALNVYLQGLRSRLFPKGVAVTTIRLGPVHTPMTVDHEKNALFATKERAARDIVRAADARRAEAYVPSYWLPIMGFVRSLPERVFQRIASLSGR